MSKAINSVTMRKNNRGQVLKNLVISPGISRSELAKKSGLTKMTITNIVGELLERGIAVEKEKKILGEPHKNPIELDLAPGCPRIIGVQIQRDYCRAVLCDFRLNILEKRESRFEQITLEKLKVALYITVGELMQYGNILGIGIGSIGPVDAKAGMISNPPNFGDIHDFDVVGFMKEKFRVPVCMEHHYNCAALAEFYFGERGKVRNFMFLGITHGVGMGGIVNGQTYGSFFGSTPEVGHVSVDYRGRMCWCQNRGCLERYVGTDVMTRELNQLTGLELTFPEYCALEEHEEVTEYFYRVMDVLKTGLIGVMNLFRPDLIVIGDEGRHLPKRHLEYLEEEVNRVHLFRGKSAVAIRTSSIRKDVFQASAAMEILERVFQGEFLFD